jgi:hypothetical protein
VAYSPDGQRLASTSYDQSVRIWDAGTGQQLLCLKGHTGNVIGVAYSPDGQRLASTSYDQSVRIWDAASGQELLTLKGHTAQVNTVAYSPDGRRLASADMDGALRVWEASPVPTEVWHRRALVTDVHSLFGELLLREHVVAALRHNPELSDADREFAVLVAQTHDEDAEALNVAAWKVVKMREPTKDTYALALRWAEAAVHAAPGDGSILNTLGVAQYRVGQYKEALSTLTKSEKRNTTPDGPLPPDLAFQAMAQHQLGKKAEAKATLSRLREAMKQPGWANDAEAQGFLREADELIEGKPAGKKE